MKNVVINGKTVNIGEVDFNAMCELEDNGFPFTGQKKVLLAIRACVAYFMGIDVEDAGHEIEAHIKNGGSIDDLHELVVAVTESDFFQMKKQMAEKK